MKQMTLISLLVGLLSTGTVLAQDSMPGMSMGGQSMSGSSMNKGTMPGMTMGTSTAGMNTAGMQTSMNALQGLSGKAFDRAYLSMMIPHHQMAVEMSQAVLPKGKDPTVKKWATQIIADQNREINEMTAWLKTLDGPDTKMQAMMKQSMSGMGQMVSSAQNPDRAFVQGMISHHASAISMATLALQKSSDSRVLKVSRDIVRSQAQEMYDFQLWLQRK